MSRNGLRSHPEYSPVVAPLRTPLRMHAKVGFCSCCQLKRFPCIDAYTLASSENCSPHAHRAAGQVLRGRDRVVQQLPAEEQGREAHVAALRRQSDVHAGHREHWQAPAVRDCRGHQCCRWTLSNSLPKVLHLISATAFTVDICYSRKQAPEGLWYRVCCAGAAQLPRMPHLPIITAGSRPETSSAVGPAQLV